MGRFPHTASQEAPGSFHAALLLQGHVLPHVSQEMREERNEGMCPALRRLDRQGHALHPGGLAVQFLCAKERACCVSVTQPCVHLHSQHPHMQATTPHTRTYTVLHPGTSTVYQPPPGAPRAGGNFVGELWTRASIAGHLPRNLLFISVKSHPQKLLSGRKPAAGIIAGFDSRRFGSISWLHMKCACSEHPFQSL